jgi:adenine/guanine phosphoribosyltransferase-like PRPP-binding protein
MILKTTHYVQETLDVSSGWEFAEAAANWIINDAKERDLSNRVTLVCRGMSGVSLATQVATALYNRNTVPGMIYVRKPETKTYSHYPVEYALHREEDQRGLRFNPPQTMYFVDDLVDTGATVEEVIKALTAKGSATSVPFAPKLIGVFVKKWEESPLLLDSWHYKQGRW